MQLDVRLYDELTEIEKLSLQSSSYSRLSSFDWCEAQYFYSYILKLPQEFGPKALLGNIVHKALEITVRDGEGIDLVELLENYQAAREEYDPDETQIDDELYAVGVEMLQLFASQRAGSVSSISHAEMSFEIVFHGVLLRGFIDSVFLTDTTATIIDYKSGKWEVNNNAVATNLQLGIYALYLKYIYPDKTITAGLHYLQSGKIKKHTFTDEDLIGVQNRLRDAIDKVRDHNNFLPTKDMWKCKTCSYAVEDICRAGSYNVVKMSKSKNKLVKEDLGTYS